MSCYSHRFYQGYLKPLKSTARVGSSLRKGQSAVRLSQIWPRGKSLKLSMLLCILRFSRGTRLRNLTESFTTRDCPSYYALEGFEQKGGNKAPLRSLNEPGRRISPQTPIRNAKTWHTPKRRCLRGLRHTIVPEPAQVIWALYVDCAVCTYYIGTISSKASYDFLFFFHLYIT